MLNPLRGIWPAVVIQTHAGGGIEHDAVESATRFYAQAGVHGVYTADTASEFYTMEYDEWDELATHFREVTLALNVPAGIGCTWTNQKGALRRVARALKLGFQNIHLSEPYWIRLNEDAQRTFWTAVSERAGSLPIIIYAGSQGQLPLDGHVVQRIRGYCPGIAGTKTTGFDALATNSLIALSPDLSHFVHETVLSPWVALGAAGCPSSLAALSPSFMIRWFDSLETGDWQTCFEIQRRVNLFYEEAAIPIRKKGYVIDKALAELGGCSGITRHLRPPYPSLPDELFSILERSARKHLPECFT